VAADKKGALKTRRTIVFVDESAFMLQPLLRATWAPLASPPVIKSWDRHDRLTVISALTVSPVLDRLRLYFRLQPANARGPDVLEFLRVLQRRLRRQLIVILDRLAVHRWAARHLTQSHGERFHFEWLPAYAPELNPVEYVWARTKYADLTNFVADDIVHLRAKVRTSLGATSGSPKRMRGCFSEAHIDLGVF
jgi:hypothetical protein